MYIWILFIHVPVCPHIPHPRAHPDKECEIRILHEYFFAVAHPLLYSYIEIEAEKRARQRLGVETSGKVYYAPQHQKRR
jgi:hypothetical protein